ncbi:AEC family transporter [Xanthobacter sp. TB0136]|uniref:AEC family transporter n=1 Tax=Xanthobacter sp. TB0136 TaxID=3459177 RepID=UPI0040393C23
MPLEIFARVAFLISIAGLGYGVGRVLKLSSKDIAALLIYVIAPVVIFISIMQSPADWSYFAYTGWAFLVASSAGICAYFLARMVWSDGRANVMGFTGGTGNTGYFGLPLVFALFDGQQVAIAVFIIIGVTVYEFSIGYFITARGVMDTRESLKRVVRLPYLYAAFAGMILKSFDVHLGPILSSGLENFKGAYSVLGMMMIGITMSMYRKLELDWSFLAFALGWKHVLCPALGLIIFGYVCGLPPETLAVVMLMLSTPLAANTVVVASHLGVHPEKAACAVMASTLLAAISVPLTVALII